MFIKPADDQSQLIDRHSAVLKPTMATIELPTRLGLCIPPSFHSRILVSVRGCRSSELFHRNVPTVSP